MAATSTGQQAGVDLWAISSIPGPSLTAYAGVGPPASSDAFCLQEEKQQQSLWNPRPAQKKDFQGSPEEVYICMEYKGND